MRDWPPSHKKSKDFMMGAYWEDSGDHWSTDISITGFAEDLSLYYTGTFHNIPVFPKVPKISNGADSPKTAHAKGILYF